MGRCGSFPLPLLVLLACEAAAGADAVPADTDGLVLGKPIACGDPRPGLPTLTNLGVNAASPCRYLHRRLRRHRHSRGGAVAALDLDDDGDIDLSRADSTMGPSSTSTTATHAHSAPN